MDEVHTQMTTRQLDTMLAEAHRRGALEALRRAISLLESPTPRGILACGVLCSLLESYEEKTEK